MSNNQISLFSDNILYDSDVSFIDFPKLINRYLSKNKTEIKVLSFISEFSLIELINELFKNQQISGSIHKSLKNFSTYYISGNIGRKTKITISGYFLIISHPSLKNVWFIVTDEDRIFVDRLLKPTLKKIRPRLTRPLLTTPQFEELLLSYQKLGIATFIRVTQTGQRGKIKSIGAKKFIESERKWTDKTVKEVFSELKEIGSWMTDISIEYKVSETNQIGQLKFDRYATLTFKGEALNSFYYFTDNISKMVYNRYLFFKNRGKSKSNQYISKPFGISYNADLFSNKEQITKLKEVIHSIPVSKCTILHGNPYFHSVFIDYLDGSICELLIIDERNITIIPQGKSTVRSLQRLISKIFYSFREGELIEALEW